MAKGSTPAWGEGVVCRCLTDRTTTAPSCHPPPMDFGSATRARLLTELPWKPIRGCPGRLVLDGLSERFVEELAGPASPASPLTSKMAPDPIVIVQLADGGLISYVKPDGRWLHTLATPEAFERKCRQLELIQDGA